MICIKSIVYIVHLRHISSRYRKGYGDLYADVGNAGKRSDQYL